jgi:hypothetical protein
MDDLEILRDAWGQPEPPSQAAYSAARAAVLERLGATAGPVPRRRTGRWAGGMSLTAAAAAVAVAVATGVGWPTGGHGSPAASRPTAREILLAAATTAQTQPTGIYWHVKMTWEPNPAAATGAGVGAQPKWVPVTSPNGHHEGIRVRPGYIAQVGAAGKDAGKVRHMPVRQAASPGPKLPVLNTVTEEWIARGGKYWTAPPGCAAPPGTAVFEDPEGQIPGVALPDGYLTYDRAAQLPTGPAALTAWFARYDKTSDVLAADLVNLLYDAVPSGIRAAAFRALAAFPGAENLGPVNRGQSLLIPFPGETDGLPSIKLIVDTATSLVRSETTVKGTWVINTAEWTKRLPKVIPQPPKTACLPGR